MRISTLQIFNVANNSITEANQEIVETQTQLSTGRRVLSPADDPVATTQILKLEQTIVSVEQYNRNIDLAENSLTREETAIDAALNLIQRIREIAVQAGNTASITDNDYLALAAEVDSRLDELQGILNTRNDSGDYIFGGYRGGDIPFTGDARSGFRYEGDEGQIEYKVSDTVNVPVSDSGKRLFVDIESSSNTFRTSVNPANQSSPPIEVNVGRVIDQVIYDRFYPQDMVLTFDSATTFTLTERTSGNVIESRADDPNFPDWSFTPGGDIEVEGLSFRVTGSPAIGDQVFIESSENVDILTILARFSEAMTNYDGTQDTRTDLEDTVSNTLANLDNAQTSLLEVTAELGARSNTLESVRNLHLDTELVSREILSELRDLDYADASTRLASQTLILEAAQASFVRVSQLTLFSRL